MDSTNISRQDLELKVVAVVSNFLDIIERYADETKQIQWVDAIPLVEEFSTPEDDIIHTRFTVDVFVNNPNK